MVFCFFVSVEYRFIFVFFGKFFNIVCLFCCKMNGWIICVIFFVVSFLNFVLVGKNFGMIVVNNDYNFFKLFLIGVLFNVNC